MPDSACAWQSSSFTKDRISALLVADDPLFRQSQQGARANTLTRVAHLLTLAFISRMKMWKLYTANNPKGALFQGLVGLGAALIFGAVYSLVAQENGFKRFAFPIFGVPLTLTTLKLLSCLATNSNGSDETKKG